MSKKRRRRKSMVATFFKIVVSMVLIFIVFAGAGIFAYTKFASPESGSSVNGKGESISASDLNIIDSLIGKDMTLNLAVFGVDADETRTDVMFVLHYDSKSEKISVISVPRDTRVEITDEMRQYLRENGKYNPGVCKINEVHAYAGKEKGDYFSCKQLEDLLGVKIDNYILINFDAFVQIVDIVGGVDVYVPQDMYWDMTDTGDILINLKEGMQHLDGAHAEQLVRFRRYKNGDVDRVAVQQAFLKELANKVLSSETIIKNMPEYIKTVYNNVKTDISISDMIKYSSYLNKVNKDTITMDTIPGLGQYVGNVSYYVHDEAGTKALVKRRFLTHYEYDKDGNILSKNMNIEVANGTDVKGLAGENQQMLIEKGFNVPDISTYKGESSENTRIIVYEEGMGKDLLEYYPNAEIIVDEGELSGETDILIILGTEFEEKEES